MSFNPNSDKTIRSMLNKIDQDSFESLFNFIPNELKYKNQLNIGSPLSEIEIINYINTINKKNKSATHEFNVFIKYE